MSAIEIYDTTLRDGAQQEGIALSVDDKFAIARLLDDLGVTYIEGGWPGAIPKDTEFFARLQNYPFKHAKLAAFGSTCKAGASADEDPQVAGLLNSGAPTITLVAKSDPRHVEQALRTDLAENLRMVRDTVTYLVSQGREVILDLEHFFDGLIFDQAYGLQVAVEAARAGAATVVCCDTNGGMLPHMVTDLLGKVRVALDEANCLQTKIGMHAHNDTGCAVANSLAAVSVGAVQVQGTVNGYGERTGNANLLTIIANLEIKYGMEGLPAGKLEEISRVSHAVAELANMPPFARDPYVGASAFAHKAGLHASAIRVDPDLYQHIDPALVGNDMRMLVSEMAGRASIELKGKELGFDLTGKKDLLATMMERVKEREARGYTYDAADASFELLLRSEIDELPPFFTVESWRAMVTSRPVVAGVAAGDVDTEAEATVKLRTGQGRVVVTGEGNGPVNALDNALRAALIGVYPEVAEFKLVDFRVRILDQDKGTDAIIRALMRTSDGDQTWSTVGVGTDIIEASWEALVDSVTWGLIHHGVNPR